MLHLYFTHFKKGGEVSSPLKQSSNTCYPPSPPPEDPELLEALANDYMHKQSLDFYLNAYGIQLSKDPVDVPRQEQIEFDDDYFTSAEKVKYELPKPIPRRGDGIEFKWQQGGVLGRGSYGCVLLPSTSIFLIFTGLPWTQSGNW